MEKVTRPIILKEKDILVRDVYITTLCYTLRREEFEVLVAGESKWTSYKDKLFWAGMAFLIKIVAAALILLFALHCDNIENVRNQVSFNLIDWVTCALCFLAAFICYLKSRYAKSYKDELIHKIRNYYNRSVNNGTK